MGFSVSGSAAIIFVAMFIAFGMWHSAVTNGFERVSDAQDAHADSQLERQNTEIVVDSAVLDQDEDQMRVRATNTGATGLSLNETDVLVDSEYETGWRDGADVASRTETYLWAPGEQLEFNVSTTSADRVKLVTGPAVANTTEVSTT